MKNRTSAFLAASLILSLGALSASAQIKKKKGQFFLVSEAVVLPSKTLEYVEAARKAVAIFSRQQFPYSLSVYSADDYHYYSLIPVKNLADIDGFFWALEEIKKRDANEVEIALRMFERAHKFLKWSVYIWRPDLSYRTEDPVLQQREGDFVYMDFCYLYPGRDAEFESLIADLMSLMKRKNRSEMINTLVGHIGTDQPMYILTTNAKNAADFYLKNDRFWKALGKEGGDLYRKIVSLIRKREIKHSWFLPDLSYNPK